MVAKRMIENGGAAAKRGIENGGVAAKRRRVLKRMAHLIEGPRPHDAAAIGRMQLRAWLQTYLNEDAGIDEAWIRQNVGSVATAEGIARWQEFVEEAERQPHQAFCRVVRGDDEIVGFLCGRRDDVVTLGPMYLLAEAQGSGLGSRLMDEFLVWAGAASMRLWVTAYNERAIRFYARYGFEVTDESELWKGRLPNVRMVRPWAEGRERGRSVREEHGGDGLGPVGRVGSAFPQTGHQGSVDQ